MKKIEVTDEMYAKLLEISKEINTQDNRMTAMPYYFQIREDKEVIVPEYSGEKKYVYDGEIISYEQLQEIVSEQEDYSSMQEFIEENNIEIIYTEKRHIFSNVFFTEKACKEHIKSNKHHYNNPVDCLNYASRNPEMETIMQFLCELSGGKLDK